MGPWKSDAHSITEFEVNVDTRKSSSPEHKYLITPQGNPDMREFVENTSVGIKQRVVVAPKGYGKTFLLRYRAALLRKAYAKSGMVFFPSGGSDIEYLEVLLDLEQLWSIIVPIRGPSEWARIWECALLITACQTCQIDKFGKTFFDTYFSRRSRITVSANLAQILKLLDKRKTLISEDIEFLRDVFDSTNFDIAMFIDNADEAFKDLHDAEYRKARIKIENSNSPDIGFMQYNPKLWNDLQAGLLLSIRTLERSMPKIHVYTSLRAEALNDLSDPVLLQAKDYCVELKYPKGALKRIFLANIEKHEPEECAFPESENPYIRWLGLEKITHRYVKNPCNSPTVEHVFDFLLRHTLHSPRDLMVLGEQIANSIPLEARRDPTSAKESLRSLVNKVATTIFSQWKITAIPRWSDSYTKILGRVKSNVLSDTDLKALNASVDDNGVTKRYRPLPFSVYFYQHGLLGRSQQYPNSVEQQEFLVSWEQRFDSGASSLPPAERYFMHPILADVIRHYGEDSSQFTPNEKNVVGYYQPFYSKPFKITISIVNGRLPSLNVDGQNIIGGRKLLTLPQIGLLTLLYAVKETEKTVLEWSVLKRTYSRFEKRFGKQSKNWLSSVQSDHGHLNRKLLELLNVSEQSRVVSCHGFGSANELVKTIDVDFCTPEDIFIDETAALDRAG